MRCQAERWVWLGSGRFSFDSRFLRSSSPGRRFDFLPACGILRLMGLTAYLVLPGVLLFASASFFFALAESSLFTLGKWRARQLAERSPQRGVIVARLLEQPSELLATIVLGNTLANGLIVALALWPALSGRWSLAWSLGAIFPLVL